MKNPGKRHRNPGETRGRILEAARDLLLRQGFAATGVDEICRAANVTKGAFFHHFESKEALGGAALSAWAAAGSQAYVAANDPGCAPLDRVHRYFDVMIGFVREGPEPITCLIGMIAQEAATTSEALQQSTSEHFQGWADVLVAILDAAKAQHPPRVPFDSQELAWFISGVWQGSMLVAKARQDRELIIRNLEHARAYTAGLFNAPA